MKVVVIQWHDAAGHDGWQMTADMQKPEPHVCWTVGFLVAETEESVRVSHTDGKTQLHGVFDIPRGCIKEMRPLLVDTGYVGS